MYRIEMRIGSTPESVIGCDPLIIETKDGIQNLCTGLFGSRAMEAYGILSGTFEEKVEKLKKLEAESDFFFDVRFPDARFSLVEY